MVVDASVKRYDKHARLLKELHRMPREPREYADAVERDLNSLLAGKKRPLAPPFLKWKSRVSIGKGELTGCVSLGTPLARPAKAKGAPLASFPRWSTPGRLGED